MKRREIIRKPSSVYLPEGASNKLQGTVPENSPVVIFGLSEAATEFVSGLVSECGVALYNEFRSLGSDKLANDFETSALNNRVQDLNDLHRHWGWCDCRAHVYLEEISSALPAPSYIVVWDDVVTVARNSGIRSVNFSDKLVKAKRDEDSFLATIPRLTGPVLMVSRDKAFQSPHLMIEEICDFLQLPTPRDVFNRLEMEALLRSYITPG